MLKEKISLLVQLQQCDDEIRSILNRKKEGPLKIRKLEEKLNAFREKVLEDDNSLQALKKERYSLEQDVQDFENKIAKSNIKLSNIKSNKEYQAALNEIEELKKRKFETEDKVLQIMESMEEVERVCRMNDERQKELEAEFEKEKVEIEKELIRLDKELEKVEAEREKLCRVIDEELFHKYSFLKERKGGQAISAVVGGICQACHMNIPPQRYNDLIKGGSLLTCPNCNRLIYWGGEISIQKASV
ncbi:MAG: hypothetical protein JRJ03_16065 [Deltaproteobacteria bacterium]|nr:hypothetical protein [Deltaproteobacteria bacterium]